VEDCGVDTLGPVVVLVSQRIRVEGLRTIRESDRMRDGQDKEGRRRAARRRKIQQEIQWRWAESRGEERRQHQRREVERPGKMLMDKVWAAVKERWDIREEGSKSCCRTYREDEIPLEASLDAKRKKRQGQEQEQEQKVPLMRWER